jgi:hypothetical protein
VCPLNSPPLPPVTPLNSSFPRTCFPTHSITQGLEALEVPEEEPADGKRRGKGGKVKKAALNVLSPEEMFGKFEEESAGPKIIVQKSLIEGLEVICMFVVGCMRQKGEEGKENVKYQC